jgi:hypothetical protein
MERADLRKHFQDEANQVKSDEQFEVRSAQLSSIEDTLIETFNNLLMYLDGKVTKTEVINQLNEISTPDVAKLEPILEKLNNSIVNHEIDLKPVVDALNALKREVTVIPQRIPKQEQRDSIKVTNLDEIKLDTSRVEKAINALDLKVDVKAPIINTEKVDLKPLKDIMLDLLKAFNKQKLFKDGDKVEVSNIKDIPLADLEKVEKKLDDANKLLKAISEKKSGGGGGGGNGTPYTDSNGVPKNVILASGKIPVDIDNTTSSEEAILLRRLVKIMESQANTDSNLRQRVVVENIMGTTLGRAMTGLDSGAGVAAPNIVTAAAPFTAPSATYFQPVWVGPVDQRFQIMDQARNAYANGIRNNLSFS